MNNDKIYIIGAGGFGKEVRSMLADMEYVFAGFADDNFSRDGVTFSIDRISAIMDNRAAWVIGIGSSKTRKQVYARLPPDLHFPVLIHPSVIIQDKSSVSIGKGGIICTGSIFTCDIEMGDLCLINLNCTVGHDVKMGAFCSLMPAVNLSGNVILEDEVFIGTGATILPGRKIGHGAIIGAGAVVTEDIPPNCTAVGIPAKPIKFHNS